MAGTSPKVFLYGYYGFGNVGDDLLLSTVISTLSRFAPDAKFVVRSLNPVPSVFNEHIHYVPLEQIMARLAWPRWFRLVCYLWKAWQALAGCSYFVFGGGTVFHARGGSSVNLALIAMLVIMARLRGARVFALGVGVGPLPTGLPRFLMGIVLCLVRDFAVRDESSLANCRSVFALSHIRITADLVFALPMERPCRVSDSRPVLGITLAAGDIGHNVLGQDKFLNNLASGLQRLWNLGWQIRFLSFQEINCEGVIISDAALFATLYRYGLSESAHIVRVNSLPTEVLHQFSDISVVAGMRFHGHVLAARMDIPFIGIGRDSKVADLCSHFSMPFVDLKDLVPDRFVAIVQEIRNQSSSQEKAVRLSQVAVENFNIIRVAMS